MSVSDEILKRISEAYRRIRNTARFLLANLAGFDPKQHLVAQKDMLALDRWAVDRAFQMQQEILKAYDNYTFHQIYQKLHQFCVVDMGAAYLDIIKDRQYTCATESLARRSAQTAMYHIVESLARLLAPILSFTAEEIWQSIPGQRGESVFLQTWYDGLFPLDAGEPMNPDFWAQVFSVRETVSKELEKLRVAGSIGSSLDAEVEVYADGALIAQLGELGDELRFVFITSYARLHPASERPSDAAEGAGFWVKAQASTHAKCVRCWHHRADVGTHPDHPQLCGRCVENVSQPAGENRRFA
jgi:isoleucyl-tRNA synthetase